MYDGADGSYDCDDMLTVLELRFYCQASTHDIWSLNNSIVWQDTGGKKGGVLFTVAVNWYIYVTLVVGV